MSMSIGEALRPLQAAQASESAAASFQIGIQKKAQDVQANAILTLLASADLGRHVDIRA